MTGFRTPPLSKDRDRSVPHPGNRFAVLAPRVANTPKFEPPSPGRLGGGWDASRL